MQPTGTVHQWCKVCRPGQFRASPDQSSPNSRTRMPPRPRLLPLFLLLGCGHSEPFTNPDTGTDQPFDPGPPVRLTANRGGDFAPAWPGGGAAPPGGAPWGGRGGGTGREPSTPSPTPAGRTVTSAWP